MGETFLFYPIMIKMICLCLSNKLNGARGSWTDIVLTAALRDLTLVFLFSEGLRR